MKKCSCGFAVFLITGSLCCVTYGQINKKPSAERVSSSEDPQSGLLREVQLLRELVEQLRKELIEVEVATIPGKAFELENAKKELERQSQRLEVPCFKTESSSSLDALVLTILPAWAKEF